MFINANSNHLPSIFKHPPNSIGRKISSRSCDDNEFEKSAPVYNKALKARGFKASIQFNNVRNVEYYQPKDKKRSGKILWFNPPI